MEHCLIDRVIRTKRKTLALQIMPDTRLVIHAPAGTSDETLRKAIQKKMPWILKKQRIARESFRPPVNFVNGEKFLYLGEWHKLLVLPDASVPLALYKNEFLLSETRLPEARRLFEEWYKKKAFEIIHDRTRQYAESTGLKYTNISITSAKKRWGSCSLKGNLCFAWRLVMTPLTVVDYVIVHELAHLEEHNHSSRFWRKVSVIFPDYRQAKLWLRNNYLLLNL